jgi:YesN/AraC family two-component response regulator
MPIQIISKKINRTENSLPFEIHSIETLLMDRQEDRLQVSRSHYTLIWVQQGAGEIFLDLDQSAIKEGTVYCIKPGQTLRAVLEDATQGFLITFSREFVELYESNISKLGHYAFFSHSWTLPEYQIDNGLKAILEKIIVQMLQEYHSVHDLRNEVLRGFLIILIIYLTRPFEKHTQIGFTCRKKELVNIFYALLEKHFSTKKMVKDYAEILAVTPGHLNAIVKEISGFTARYHIQQRIILEAKRRVLYEGGSLKETAYSLGFCDPAHFSKFFKNTVGANFTTFRNGTPSFVS